MGSSRTRNLRAEGEGSGDVDALALAAAELMGEAREGGGVEADGGEEIVEAGRQAFGRGLAVDGEGLGEDLADGHAGVEGGVGILEDDLHAAAEEAHLRGFGGGERLAGEEDFARGGLDEVEEHAGYGAFAGAGFAYQAEGFAGVDGEADVVDDADGAGAGGVVFGQIAGFEERRVAVIGGHRRMVASGKIGLNSELKEQRIMPAAVSLAGKTVLVTGASAGIGWATALAFAELGANLVVTARREARLQELCEKIVALGGQAGFVAGDATQDSVAEECVALTVKKFGSLDILINNAGVGNYKNLVDTSAAEYDEMMDANMKSSFLFSRHAAPVMIAQKSGEILFVSSVAGLQGFAGEAVYCASKFAQVGFAQALDGELRKFGIKVGAFCPGGVKSEFAIGKGRTEEGVAKSTMMEPGEVADAIVFACTQPKNFRVLSMVVRHMGEPPV